MRYAPSTRYHHLKSCFNLPLFTFLLQESYVELEKAIRSLASFYSRAGPSAQLPEEVRSEILNDLNTAEEFL